MDTRYTARESGEQGMEVIEAITEKRSTPEQKLAAAVLFQAVMDCREVYRKQGLSAAKRSPAYFDLAYPLSMVRHWCEVINIDPDSLAAAFRKNMMHERSSERMFRSVIQNAPRAI